MKFKTTVQCGACVASIKKALTPLAPADKWTVDLHSPERILTYEGTLEVDPEEVMRLVRNLGFDIERID